jgi:hypothetical protein
MYGACEISFQPKVSFKKRGGEMIWSLPKPTEGISVEGISVASPHLQSKQTKHT